MDWKTIIPEVIAVVITAIVTFLSTRRKYKAESKDIETRVSKSIFSTYDDVIAAMHKQINEYIKRIDELDKKVQNMVEENNLLRGELAEFEKKYGKQTKTPKKLES